MISVYYLFVQRSIDPDFPPFVWKEFKEALAGTNSILVAMFGFYLVSLVLITAARF